MSKYAFGLCSFWSGCVGGIALTWGIYNRIGVTILAFVLSFAAVPGLYLFLQATEKRKEKKALPTPKQ